MTRIGRLVCLGFGLLAFACGPEVTPVDVPTIDTAGMEPQVRLRLETRRRAVADDPSAALAWGELGMACHAHDLFEEARAAYREAMRLEPTDARWAYYLGDVETSLGTDLDAALAAFDRFIEKRPDYAPAHLRIARVHVLRDELDAAAASFRRAVELEEDLVPARVGLGQVLLAENQVDDAVKQLEIVVAGQPRHGQALAALGQAYLRQGRVEDARAIAEQARQAGRYVLYDDPLMAEVVAQGVSALAHWERARAYLDNGDYRQALAGLQKVAPLRPDDASVHEQMALAYSELGEKERALQHLERVIALDPERSEARVQLSLLLIDAERPGDALVQLEEARAEAPEDAEIAWLHGKALAGVGRLELAEEAFAEAVDLAVRSETAVPDWVFTEWGTILARQGRFQAALERFGEALERSPGDARALFSYGLALEGLGRPREAIGYYRRSMDAEPNPLAEGRLRALASG